MTQVSFSKENLLFAKGNTLQTTPISKVQQSYGIAQLPQNPAYVIERDTPESYNRDRFSVSVSAINKTMESEAPQTEVLYKTQSGNTQASTALHQIQQYRNKVAKQPQSKEMVKQFLRVNIIPNLSFLTSDKLAAINSEVMKVNRKGGYDLSSGSLTPAEARGMIKQLFSDSSSPHYPDDHIRTLRGVAMKKDINGHYLPTTGVYTLEEINQKVKNYLCQTVINSNHISDQLKEITIQREIIQHDRYGKPAPNSGSLSPTEALGMLNELHQLDFCF